MRGRLRHNVKKFLGEEAKDDELKYNYFDHIGVFVNTFTGTIAFTKNNYVSRKLIFRGVREI